MTDTLVATLKAKSDELARQTKMATEKLKAEVAALQVERVSREHLETKAKQLAEEQAVAQACVNI